MGIIRKLKRGLKAGAVSVDGERPVVMIGLPMHRSMHGRTQMNLIHLAEDLRWRFGWGVYMEAAKGALVDANRNRLCEQFLKVKDATHLLMVDDDMLAPQPFDPGAGNPFEGNVIARMVGWKKDIVGGLYFARQMPTTPFCARLSESGQAKPIIDLDFIRRSTVEEVDFVGTGFMLIRRRVIEAVGKAWFRRPVHWDKVDTVKEIRRIIEAGGDSKDTTARIVSLVRGEMDAAEIWGEDYGFCRKARMHGFKVWVDKTWELGHIGDYIYTARDFIAQQQRLLSNKVWDEKDGMDEKAIQELYEKEAVHAQRGSG